MDEDKVVASLKRSGALKGRPWLIGVVLCAAACLMTFYSASTGASVMDPEQRPGGLLPYSTKTDASMLSLLYFSRLAVSMATQRALCAIWGLCSAGCLLAYYATRRQALRDALLIRLIEQTPAPKDDAPGH